jgi:SAM-dependent methyltransferase
MTLYETLTPLYDELFPIDPATPAFLDSLIAGESRPARPRLLDAGCATGAHALAMASRGWAALGIDSEAAMITVARERAGSLAARAEFLAADMLEIGDRFAGRAFELVLCLGNTLPHLVDSGAGGRSSGAAGGRSSGAAAFLAQARSLLAPGGALVLQTLNFSLPRVAPGFIFPELAAGGAMMRRSYLAPPPDHPQALRFSVELEAGGKTQRGETLLLPLGPRRIGTLLLEAGFAPPTRLSGWGGQPFDEATDLYCITIARA